MDVRAPNVIKTKTSRQRISSQTVKKLFLGLGLDRQLPSLFCPRRSKFVKQSYCLEQE